MRLLGFLLITAGFIWGSYIASMTPENVVRWELFVPAALMGVAGVVLAQIGAKRATGDETAHAGRFEIVRASLESIVAKIKSLDEAKDGLHPYELHIRIDELFPADLNAFVDSRQIIATRHGLEAYANVMNEFAAGERYLNRVWSASVDCYVDEAREYVGRAREQFERADRLLASL
jgi:hypothetical protein